MTWEFQVTVSDDIHRLVNREGETCWGIAHDGFDVEHPDARGEVDVDLPSGRSSLLVVPPLPGGLVLDAVRSYQGLVEGELSTLFLGIFAELLKCRDGETRLCLECIGLAADGRPRIIPGIRRTPGSSVRFAIGEMIYHAAHGRPWAQSLLPVNIAMPDCSQSLRSLVAQLLDDSAAADTEPELSSRASLLRDTIDEVSIVLRRTGTPSALPLLPSDHDLDPGQALTARLRAANASHPDRGSVRASGGAPVPDRNVLDPDHGQPNSDVKVRDSTRSADRLRAASRRGARSRRLKPQQARDRDSSLAARIATATMSKARQLCELLPTMRRPHGPWSAGLRASVVIALCMTVIGATVMVRSADSEGDSASVSAPQDHVEVASLSDAQVVDVLLDLCEQRSEALSDGDSEALEALTVNDSTAAVADELLDVEAFAGNDYSIELDDFDLRESTEDRILVAAQMLTSVHVDGQKSKFTPRRVEFELVREAGDWKIAEVIELTN